MRALSCGLRNHLGSDSLLVKMNRLDFAKRAPNRQRLGYRGGSAGSLSSRRTYGEYTRRRISGVNMYPVWLRARPFPLVKVKMPILGRGLLKASGCGMSWNLQSFCQK